MTIKRSSTLKTLFVLSLLLSSLLLTQFALAQTKTFHWGAWDISMTLQPDGSIDVTETQTITFIGEPFTFGFRSIPVGREGNNDGISNVRVREGDFEFAESPFNEPGTFEVLDEGGEVRINWYFEPALGNHTYTFSYTVHGAVRQATGEDGSGDQIYWTVIPSDHPARVDSSLTTITLPPGITPQKFTGTDQHLVAAYLNDVETTDVFIDVSDDEQTITYDAQRAIMPGERLDVRVQFPPGMLTAATPEWQQQEQRADAAGLGILGLGALLFVGGPLAVLLLWYTRGRDPQLGIVVPDYITEPPDDLPPAMAGALIDEKVDMQDIVSTLVHLANRGYLVMEEEKNGYTFTRTERADSDLRGFEQLFLSSVFRGEDSRKLSSLRYKFASKIPKLREQIIDELVTEGYLPQSPDAVRTSYKVMALVLVAIAGIGLFFGMMMAATDIAGFICFPAFAIGLIAIALLIAGRHMPKKTVKGTESAAKWNAFKNYLKNIKQYAGVESSGEIFDKYLGYAIAFGLERSFISTFSQASSTAVPPWYIPFPQHYGPMSSGPGSSPAGSPRPSESGSSGGVPNLGDVSGGLTGGLAGMSAGLTRMLNSTSNVLKSTPPSTSSSSGSRGFSSGGGFSGGFSGGSSGGGGSGGFG